MADEPKLNHPEIAKEATAEAVDKVAKGQAAVESEDEEHEDPAEGSVASSTAAKKKKSKRKRAKQAIMGGSSNAESSSSADTKGDLSKLLGGLSRDQLNELLKNNPALSQQLKSAEGASGEMSAKDLASAMKMLNVEDIMTGLASSGKNVKDMASYKFWQTQPVPKFGDSTKVEEGPFKIIDPEQVPKEPGPLVDGFEWVTMDLTNDEEIQEVYSLLYGHYVEDDEAMFRFNYSLSFLRW